MAFGIVATVLFVLGLHQRLSDLADASQDRLGLDLESEKLPQRIYGPRKRRDVPANTIRPK